MGSGLVVATMLRPRVPGDEDAALPQRRLELGEDPAAGLDALVRPTEQIEGSPREPRAALGVVERGRHNRTGVVEDDRRLDL